MDYEHKTEFEKQLRLLMEAGSMAKAEGLVREAAAQAETPEIAAALDRPLGSLTIEDWSCLGADIDDAKRWLPPEERGKDWQAAFAALINRAGFDKICVEISFGLDAEPDKHEPRRYSFMSDAEFEEYRRDVEARTFLPAGRRYRADHAPGRAQVDRPRRSLRHRTRAHCR